LKEQTLSNLDLFIDGVSQLLRMHTLAFRGLSEFTRTNAAVHPLLWHLKAGVVTENLVPVVFVDSFLPVSENGLNATCES
jgi:hypothetical protein